MGIIAPTLPTVGQLNASEDVDTRNTLSTIVNEINGLLNSDNISSLTAAKLVIPAGRIRVGPYWAYGPGAAGAIPFTTVDYDTNTMTDVSQRLTVKTAGVYQLSLYSESSTGTGTFAIRKNGTQIMFQQGTPGSTVSITDLVKLAVNDYIDGYFTNTAGGQAGGTNTSLSMAWQSVG